MLYAWIGFLKPDAEPIPQSVQQLTNYFLAPPFIKIHFAGPLRDESGTRARMMMIFERESREAAESFVADSPYLGADLSARELEADEDERRWEERLKKVAKQKPEKDA